MPRIEVIPADWEHSQEKARGDGTPTVDVCRSCGLDLIEGESSPQWLDNIYPDSIVGSTDVDHPSYSHGEEFCQGCGVPLTAQDNGYED